MKRMKKPFALGAALVMLLSLAACGDAEPEKQLEKQPETSAETSSVGTAYPDKELGFQLEAPAEGETVAIMHTDLGDISLRFFPEAAPKAVENFLTLAKNGYYNGITFHRVMKDFMIQGGDPTATGSGGESIWGKDFEDEFDSKLLNLRGALSMANGGVNTNASQFFINQKTPEGTADELKKMYDYDTLRGYFESNYDQMKQYYGDSFTAYYPTVDSFIEANGGLNPYSPYVPDEAWELYAKQGGNINLDGAYRKTGGHTVFGQVYDGMEVVDAIADVSVDESNNKPIADVCIKSIDVTTYAAE